jgi:hypothetical protein
MSYLWIGYDIEMGEEHTELTAPKKTKDPT